MIHSDHTHDCNGQSRKEEPIKDEYIKLMVDKDASLEEQVTDTQLALCDVYEMIGG